MIAMPTSPREPRESTVCALAREHLAAGRPLTLAAQGHSMWPLIQHGDLVEVHPLPRSNWLVVGDIVLVALADRLVLHRVIAIAGDDVTTKGDAVARPDARMRRAEVFGALPRTAPAFNRLCAHLSARAGRPIAAVLRRLRLAGSRAT